MIFYFTATGNSLYVAKELSQALGEEKPLSIPQELKRAKTNGEQLIYTDDLIGIVYPIYGHMMPFMVQDFLNTATFNTSYFYFICTYGNRHANCVELAQQKAHNCGIEPSYISTLLMVDNWLPNFDMNDQRARIPEKHIDENLVRIEQDLKERKRWIEPVTEQDREAHEQFLSRGLSFTPTALKDFLVIDEDTCTGCGTCIKVCPAGCISFNEDGVAVRNALSEERCNACLACIHACPSGAFELPMGESNPEARFRNEHVSLNEIIAANNLS